MPSDTLTDSRGRPLHGNALAYARAAEERRRAEAEREAQHRAVARALVKLMARGPLSGPDALRNLLGEQDAALVLGAAGMNAQAAAPAPQRAGMTAGYAGHPDHDPRVTEVLLRPGATIAEINAVWAAVTAEYEGRALERLRREDEVYGRTGDRAVVRERPLPTPPPLAFVPVDEHGVPHQVSTVRREWEDYPDHQEPGP